MIRPYLLALALGLAGCAGVAPPPAAPPQEALPTRPEPVFDRPAPPQPLPAAPTGVNGTTTVPGGEAPTAVEPVKPVSVPTGSFRPAAWDQLPGWQGDDLAQAWPALLQSCKGLRGNPAWSAVCQAAQGLPAEPDAETVRAFLQGAMQPWQSLQPDGAQEGLITGYYEPLLRGSRTFGYKYRFPVYAAPDDLLVVDLSALYPELKSLRLRGRLQGNKVVPYWSRAEIETGAAPVRGKELAWVDDPVELFFLQIQGSGRIRMENGETMRIGYADQNGHPYRSIGKWLVDNGELTLDKASMQGIKDWGRRNPERLPALLNANPSYVFFRELPNNGAGPLGALGVPLTAERSIAVDPRVIPLGAPVWLATTRPNSSDPMARLVMAQDTGGAIRGNVRADFFWGFGDEAGRQAGAMKQRGRMWVLLPRDYPMPQPNGIGGQLGLK
ncbi:MAG: murein transglycosylase A [Pseudomonadota bacterium]